jgi:hypothetical protein
MSKMLHLFGLLNDIKYIELINISLYSIYFMSLLKIFLCSSLGFSKDVFEVSISKNEIQILKGEIYASKNAKIW